MISFDVNYNYGFQLKIKGANMFRKILRTSIVIALICILILFMQGCSTDTESEGTPLEILKVSAKPDTININGITSLMCETNNDNSASYEWSCTDGEFPHGVTSQTTSWEAPETTGTFTIIVKAYDNINTVSDSVKVFIKVIPSYPSPSSDKTVLPYNVKLSWVCGPGTSFDYEYDVLFGETTSPQIISSRQVVNYYQMDTLSSNKKYYWKIIAYDKFNNQFPGALWSFKTSGSEKREFELGNSGVQISMVWIPPGTFMMGAPGTLGSGDDESPSHQVTIEKGFWMGEFEVTQSQWKAIKGSKTFSNIGDRKPADNISWEDAKSFVTKLNETEHNNPWRLPTEAEWEYASRAGVYNTRFWWGDDNSYSTIRKYAWIDANSGGKSHNVGSTTGGVPNPYGIWDIAGNVWEWCEDWYHWGYVGAPNDGSAWIDPVETQRKLRGGSYYFEGRRCLPTLRSMYIPSGKISTIGFRIVRNAE